ncbi:MAG TPA: tripartite tricarboxylate transporter substrate binding protein [Burkholderiales bacterium]|nr:tripartite tricarboxylate transporter substrate binding protein [Burkholderiales bacterium]
MNRRRKLVLAAAVLAALPLASHAAETPRTDYPSRPVRMIVPFAPGGASDTVGRILQPALAEALGQQVVVDNRGGAAGMIGVEVAARATPDGYTFLLGNIGTMAINPNYYLKASVKPQNELIGVTQVVDVPGAFVVHPSLPVKSVKEIVAYLKANPGKLNFGSPAPSSANRLEMEMFLHMTGTKAVQINYKGGAGPAVVGLLGNEVQMMFVTYSSVVGHTKGGRIRMLAVIAPQRIPQTPDVSTMREQGFDMVVGSWQGVYVPKGTPATVVNKLFTATHQTMKHPDVVKRLTDNGISIVTSASPAEFKKFWDAEIRRFAKVIKEANIETE